jgi:histidine ammonia-lyase
MNSAFHYGTDRLTSSLAIAIASGSTKGILAEPAIGKIRQCATYVNEIVEKNRIVYGINTGFGALAGTVISEADTRTLQYKILQSHSVGVGNAIPPELSKLMLITKAQALAQGFSGVQLETLERIVWHINENVIPVVPEKGSVGASGDLAPLAHLFLPLIGAGEVYYKGNRMPSSKMLQQEGMNTIELGPKEGLALINGTQFIAAYAIKGVQMLLNCLDAADIIGAMSLEALTGTHAPFDNRLHDLRPFDGSRTHIR